MSETDPKRDPWMRGSSRSFIASFDEETRGDTLFESGEPVVVARAPGRLDVMGGIADYSGSLVLQWPLAEATHVAVQSAVDGFARVTSWGDGTNDRARSAEIDCAELAALAESSYEALGERLAEREGDTWAAYVIGALAVLMREYGVTARDGLRVLVRSSVPEGKGVSSSAALEVASMRAMAELFGVSIDGETAALLCQQVENRVVGAPCGIMDQMTAALGREDQLLALLCQPAEIEGYPSVPESIRFWGIDSGVRHAVSGADYASVRCGAFMGYRILAAEVGLPASRPDADGRVCVEDERWGGYLANVGVEEYESQFETVLPESMQGREFVERYGGTTDLVTTVDAERTYPVREPTQHPIREHERVTRFAELLSGSIDEMALTEMGSLMYESHFSYSACGLGSDGTDRLVEMVRRAGPGAGLYGGKITGGGSGGTVVVLGRTEAGSEVASIAERYGEETGCSPVVFAGSSPGAFRAGVRWLIPDGVVS